MLYDNCKGVVYSDKTDYSQKPQNYVNYTTTPTDNKNDCKVLCDKQQFSSMYGICEEDIFAAIVEDLKTKFTQK